MFKVNPEQIYSLFFFGNGFHFGKATEFKVFFALDTKEYQRTIQLWVTTVIECFKVR